MCVLQYFGHLMWRTDSLEKTLLLGKIAGRRRRGHRGWDGWMASPTQWTWAWVNSGSWWWTGRPGMLQSMRSQRVRHDWATELNWTELQDNCFHIVLVSAIQQCEPAMCVPPEPPSQSTPHPTPLGGHRAPGWDPWDPCAIQQLPTSCLFYTMY